jgi:Ca2+-binding RTX toxin-like protein
MGGRGNDFLDGGSGDDSLLGGNPNDPFGQDELRGGAGNDYLAGGMGDDLYVFAGGFGIDRIDDWMGNDRMTLNHIVHEDLWFWREGNALKVGVLNTPDRITIDNWFSNPGRRIETMQTLDDGFVLLENQVQQLVNAMAVFDVPASGNLTPSQADIEAVHGVIAAAWQAA